MLSAAIINGFQSHKNTAIKFSDKITVFVGKSYSGKSAILRALNFCINNSYTSEEYINDDTGSCEVIISAVDRGRNFCVSRKKTKSGKKENTYTLEIEGEKPQPFTAFGLTVPREISALFNFSDCNYQRQFASPFLAFSSNGEIAREIRKLSGIDIIDSVVSSINSKTQKLSKDVVSLEKDIADIDLKVKDLEKYDFIKLENLINTYNSCEYSYSIMQDEIPLLTYNIDEITKIDEFLSSIDPDLESKYQLLFEATNALSDLDRDVLDIKYFISSIEAVDYSYDKIPYDLSNRYEEFSTTYNNYLSIANDITSLDNLIQDICRIDDVLSNCDKYAEYSILYDKYTSIQLSIVELNTAINNVDMVDKSLVSTCRDIENSNKQYLDLVKQLEMCPLCERPHLSDDDKKIIIKNYV